MESIPADLLPNIVCNLDVRDALSLRKAAPEGVRGDVLRQECDRRLSVKAYLGESFVDPLNLLTAMSKNRVVLSGSRAAGFFVNGSCNRDSDWDFYSSGWVGAVSSFVEATSDVSVRWMKPLDCIMNIARKGEGRIVLHRRALVKVGPLNIKESLSTIGVGCDFHYDEFDRTILLEMINTGSRSTAVLSSGSCNSYSSAYRIIYGETIGKGEVVQLMVEKSKGPMSFDFLFSFHSTCVQSFITAHVAAHLYGKLASHRTSYKWTLFSTSFVGPAEKYGDRGYNVTLPPFYGRDRCVHRSAEGAGSTLLPGFNDVGAPRSAVEAYDTYARSIHWTERSNGTHGTAYHGESASRIGESHGGWLFTGKRQTNSTVFAWTA